MSGTLGGVCDVDHCPCSPDDRYRSNAHSMGLSRVISNAACHQMALQSGASLQLSYS